MRWAAQNVKVPWFAIGGINLQNIDDVLAAGAEGFVWFPRLLNEEDVAGACAKFRKKLEAAKDLYGKQKGRKPEEKAGFPNPFFLLSLSNPGLLRGVFFLIFPRT